MKEGGRNGESMEWSSLCRSGHGDNRSVVECHIDTGGSDIDEQGHGGGTSQRAEDKRSEDKEKHDQKGKEETAEKKEAKGG